MKDKIKTGIFSYGMSGKLFHCPFLHVHPNFDMVKILQRSNNSAKERYPYVEIVRTVDELLSDPDIDLIIVNTPNDTHFDFTKQALEAGKHVVVEKPFTVTVSEGKELIELAGRKNRILSVFQNRRWDGDFMTVRKVVENKLLGRLVEFESHYDRYRNFIKENTWKEDPASKTNILYDLGSHMIDQVLVLFGMPGTVYSDIRKMRTGSKVNDYFHLELAYPNIKVTVKGSYLVREAGPRYTLHGTEGSFLKWGIDPQEEALLNGNSPDAASWGEEPEENWGTLNTNINNLHFLGKLETIQGNYLNYFTNIYNAIARGEELKVKPGEALDIIRVIETAEESNRLKKTIAL